MQISASRRRICCAITKDNMQKKMLIDATHAEETRVVVVEGNKVDEFDFESLNKRQLAGNIYLAKVTRVEPSLQAAFIDYGGNRHGFLAFSEIHPDYYQIPVADREALLAEEAAYNKRDADEDEKPARKSRSRSRSRSSTKASEDGAASKSDDVVTSDVIEADDDNLSTLIEDLPERDNKPATADDSSSAAQTTQSEPVEADTASTEDVNPAAAADEGTDADAPVSETDAKPDEQANAAAAVDDTSDDADDNGDDSAFDADGPADIAQEVAPRRPRVRRYKIQEVIKVRQILLVQVVKEERGNKGAALTTYLSLAGRYCVLMPNTARGGGISRKITNATDRKKLKEIAGEITVPEGAGLIIRTAGAKRTKTEIKRDYEFLLRQWELIRDLTLKSIAPAPIYEEGSLIKRSIRDLYSRDIDEIFVEGERGYREAREYMEMLMPTHAANVKQYDEQLPLFARYQVENYLTAMFNPVVQLKSGGYIVIDVTEALVAVDVNSGRSTKESSIEDTALKTNLEAAEELARQARLRDLAGLIVIDFIDMEDRRNNSAVEKKLKDKLKTDRARIQVGRISSFGLMEMSRQRLRPGMLEATTAPCPHCHGTGRTRSDDSLALAIMRELEEEGVRRRAKEVLVSAPVNIANYILNAKREHVAMIESRFGLSVRIEGDPSLISPDYRIERLKVATRIVPQPEIQEGVVEFPTEVEAEVVAETQTDTPDEADADTAAPKKRRRRRRRKSNKPTDANQDTTADTATADATAPNADAANADTKDKPDEAKPEAAKPSKSRTRTRRKPAAKTSEPDTEKATEQVAEQSEKPAAAEPASEPAVAEVKEELVAVAKAEVPPAAPSDEPAPAPKPAAEVAPVDPPAAPTGKPASKPRVRVSAKAAMEETTTAAPAPQTDETTAESGEKKRGWWSRTLGK